MHVLITRPIEQTAATANALEKLGHSCRIEPLLYVEQLNQIKQQENYSGVLLTSRNAISALKFQYSIGERKNIPVLTTGLATADQVREAGFSKVDCIKGSALDLVSAVPGWIDSNQLDQNLSLLYPCAEQVAHDVPNLLKPHNIKCQAWPVYRTVPRKKFSNTTLNVLQNGKLDAVLLYSTRTAKTFVKLVDENNITLPVLEIFTLSKEIAQSIPTRFGSRIFYPIKPEENDLLALLNK